MKRVLPFAVLPVAAACSDLGTPLAPTSESESVVLSSRSAAAKASKVNVCHVDDMGNYRLINVSANALKAHLGHGDGLPGVGGFGLDCSVVVDPFVFVSVAVWVDYNQIVWTVAGSPRARTFEVRLFVGGSGPGVDPWLTVATIDGSESSSYQVSSLDQVGTYRIVATLTDGSVVKSDPITVELDRFKVDLTGVEPSFRGSPSGLLTGSIVHREHPDYVVRSRRSGRSTRSRWRRRRGRCGRRSRSTTWTS